MSPELTSLHGGGIAALPDAKHGPVPEKAVYRVLLTAADGNSLPMALRGEGPYPGRPPKPRALRPAHHRHRRPAPRKRILKLPDPVMADSGT